MREIKFRGISKLTNQWAIGSLVVHSNGECSIIDYADLESESYTWNDVIKETVGEFTGLKDKTGKEIYEGDIVRYILDSIDPTEQIIYIEEVSFIDGGFCVDGYTPVSILNDWECDVIGNIYENPDLI
jgi:uncharacterized phage protein (TIGR01671 family)